MSLRLKLEHSKTSSQSKILVINGDTDVEAAFIPAGKPVTFFTARIPAGPSFMQNAGMPRRSTAWVLPIQRPK